MGLRLHFDIRATSRQLSKSRESECPHPFLRTNVLHLTSSLSMKKIMFLFHVEILPLLGLGMSKIGKSNSTLICVSALTHPIRIPLQLSLRLRTLLLGLHFVVDTPFKVTKEAL